MTNAIEQTKREMYDWLRNFKLSGVCGQFDYAAGKFESALEAHLEELRKALVAVNSATVACAQHSAESFIEMERADQELEKKIEYWRFLNGNQADTIDDLRSRLEAMTEERDAIQLRLHAVDHAYSEQHKKVGKCGQVCGDRGASAKLDGSMAIVIAAVRAAQDIIVEYLVPDGIRAKRAMTKLIPLLDNEKLYSALYELEHEKT